MEERPMPYVNNWQYVLISRNDLEGVCQKCFWYANQIRHCHPRWMDPGCQGEIGCSEIRLTSPPTFLFILQLILISFVWLYYLLFQNLLR